MIRILLAAALILITVFAASWLLATWVRRNGLFFPERHPAGAWSTQGLPSEPRETWLDTRDGERLHGWYFDAGPGTPLIIWYPGNAGNLTYRAPIAARFPARGISVFLFDYRGYGKSTGEPSERDLYRDAIAAWQHAVSMSSESRPLVAYGESIGAPYAAWAIQRAGNASCIIIENSFPSLRAMAKVHYSPLPVWLVAPDGLMTSRWLEKSDIPLLVLHGKRDEVVPFQLGLDLYDSYHGSKQFFISETAGHCEIPYLETDRYLNTVVDFIERSCRSPR